MVGVALPCLRYEKSFDGKMVIVVNFFSLNIVGFSAAGRPLLHPDRRRRRRLLADAHVQVGFPFLLDFLFQDAHLEAEVELPLEPFALVHFHLDPLPFLRFPFPLGSYVVEISHFLIPNLPFPLIRPHTSTSTLCSPALGSTSMFSHFHFHFFHFHPRDSFPPFT